MIERTPGVVELAQWREEFEAASRRPLKVRMKYASSQPGHPRFTLGPATEAVLRLRPARLAD